MTRGVKNKHCECHVNKDRQRHESSCYSGLDGGLPFPSVRTTHGQARTGGSHWQTHTYIRSTYAWVRPLRSGKEIINLPPSPAVPRPASAFKRPVRRRRRTCGCPLASPSLSLKSQPLQQRAAHLLVDILLPQSGGTVCTRSVQAAQGTRLRKLPFLA